MRITRKWMLSCGALALGAVGAVGLAQTAFPLMPSVSAERDGTLIFKDRKIPITPMMSEEAKAKYIEIINRSLEIKTTDRAEIGKQFMSGAGAGIAQAREAVRKIYPVDLEETTMGGVKVLVFTPKDIAPRNRRRVAMMFNSDPVGVILSSIGRMKVIAVQYTPTQPMGSTQIVAVYRELLKTYRPAQIAMVGLSGGCQYAGNTAFWLPSQKLPFPGALALMTCAGGGVPGDTRVTLNGLDVQLADYTMSAAMRSSGLGAAGGAGNRMAPPAPGQPGREVLSHPSVPKGFPPSWLLAGTRDMSLSQTVLLHRKLRNAGVIADLNIFEGMWHGFNMEPGLPETREATRELAGFLDRYMGI